MRYVEDSHWYFYKKRISQFPIKKEDKLFYVTIARIDRKTTLLINIILTSIFGVLDLDAPSPINSLAYFFPF